MGLFDFVKNIGSKVFGPSDTDAAAKIKEHILKDNPGVENLAVTFDKGTVCLTGECVDVASREKTILLAGNVENVENVTADDLTVKEVPVDETTVEYKVEYYEIKKGDTLWKVATEFLGNGARYTEIFEANREVIKNPDLIYPGQKIRIPLD